MPIVTVDSIMLFKEIPQFPRSRYRIDVDLGDVLPMVEKYKDDHGLDMEPWFQRGHVWNPEQRVAFIEYFLRGGFAGREIFFNHPGWAGDFDGHMVLVDGLQRLTTILGFLRGEILAFGQHVREFGNLRSCQNSFCFQVNNLKTEKECAQWYIDINAGGTPHTKPEIDRVRAAIAKM